MITATLTPARRRLAIQRITALWAFCESGLGGVLHALRAPFTGLLVGSFSVLCITLIAWLSGGRYRQVLHSLLLALIVKAVVSPHSPPTAYLAVGFQGLIGYGLYKAFGVHRFSMYLVAVLALLESALQKLLTLTLFFGKSFWHAADELISFIGKELSVALPLGSVLLVTTYVGIYVAGGIICGSIATQLVRDFRSDAGSLPAAPNFAADDNLPGSPRRRKRALVLVFLFVATGIILYVSSGSQKQGALAVVQAATWTACALLIWYGLIAPVALRMLHRFLRRKGSSHSGEVQELLRMLPALRRLSVAAWRESAKINRGHRISFFIRLLVHWSLTWDPAGVQALPA
ncbi:hypothetical protein [Flaviaesturariibacter terrae]